MILDSSAIVSMLREEPGHEQLWQQLETAPVCRIGAPTRLEVGMVLFARLGLRGKTSLARLLDGANVETVPFGEQHWTVAFDAFTRFGKGRHPAGLNFGDCMSYAVAAVAGEPLLCVGDDFPQTDLDLVKLS